MLRTWVRYLLTIHIFCFSFCAFQLHSFWTADFFFVSLPVQLVKSALLSLSSPPITCSSSCTKLTISAFLILLPIVALGFLNGLKAWFKTSICESRTAVVTLLWHFVKSLSHLMLLPCNSAIVVYSDKRKNGHKHIHLKWLCIIYKYPALKISFQRKEIIGKRHSSNFARHQLMLINTTYINLTWPNHWCIWFSGERVSAEKNSHRNKVDQLNLQDDPCYSFFEM